MAIVNEQIYKGKKKTSYGQRDGQNHRHRQGDSETSACRVMLLRLAMANLTGEET